MPDAIVFHTACAEVGEVRPSNSNGNECWSTGLTSDDRRIADRPEDSIAYLTQPVVLVGESSLYPPVDPIIMLPVLAHRQRAVAFETAADI